MNEHSNVVTFVHALATFIIVYNYVYYTLLKFIVIYCVLFPQTQPDNESQTQHTQQHTREEWMLICEHNVHLEPSIVDPYENFDWTEAARMYSNLDEVPSFISSHRGSSTFTQLTSSSTVNPGCLQGKQLAIYNIVSAHLCANNKWNL